MTARTPADPNGLTGLRPGRFTETTATADDAQEARTWLEERWNGTDFRVRGGDAFTFRSVARGDERLTLHASTLTAHVEGHVPWLDRYAVTWFREGGTVVTDDRGRLESRGATPLLLPTERPFSFTMTPHRQQLVQVDAGFLESTATERHDGPAQLVAFDRDAEPAQESLVAWRAALAASTGSVVDPAASPLLRLEAQRRLVLALLDVFPWRVRDVPRAVRHAGAGRLRTAVDFVHDHAGEPLTPELVARAAGLHPRTLQQAMRERLGLSPMALVRRVRLDQVRHELSEASPGEVQIGDVARSWGFGNLGRFSAAYAERFGEYPRDTLRR